MADVKQMKKIVPPITCEIALCQYVCSWCLVSTYLIWIPGSRSILSNNQSRATLWVRDTCLIVGLLLLMIILITASVSSKMYSTAPNWEDFVFDETWSTLLRSRLSCLIKTLVWFWVCLFDVVLHDEFPRTWPLVLLDGFGEEWNTSITKSQRSRAEIPSMHRPASREMISASVGLCETEVCFLHIQLTRTNVRLPNEGKGPLLVEFESSRSLAKSESWNSPNLHCCVVFPTWQHCLKSHVRWMVRSNVPSVCLRLWSIWWLHEEVWSRTMECQVYQCLPNCSILEQFECLILTILQQPHLFFFFELMVVKTLNMVKDRCRFSHIDFFHWKFPH